MQVGWDTLGACDMVIVNATYGLTEERDDKHMQG